MFVCLYRLSYIVLNSAFVHVSGRYWPSADYFNKETNLQGYVAHVQVTLTKTRISVTYSARS